MLARIHVNPWAYLSRWWRATDHFRLAVEVEVVALLLFAVALTIMPQATLSAVAAVAVWLRDLAFSYGPAVAFAGLLTVVASLWGLRSLRQGTSDSEVQSLGRDEHIDRRLSA